MNEWTRPVIDAWNKERESFERRETEGFAKDLLALKTHIRALHQLAPKDETGWPVDKANLVIKHLQVKDRLYELWVKELQPSNQPV